MNIVIYIDSESGDDGAFVSIPPEDMTKFLDKLESAYQRVGDRPSEIRYLEWFDISTTDEGDKYEWGKTFIVADGWDGSPADDVELSEIALIGEDVFRVFAEVDGYSMASDEILVKDLREAINAVPRV